MRCRITVAAISLFCLVSILSGGASESERENPPAMNNQGLIFSENFDSSPDANTLPDGWWAEGGQEVCIRDGRLHVRANAEGAIARDRSNVSDYVCTVWNKRKFSGNLRVEFDAHIIASAPGVNNINFFFLYSHPTGKSIYETRGERADADYPKYHDLNGYIITFLQGKGKQIQYHPDGSAKARFRMRRCPGFKLMAETYDYNCLAGRTYHITVTRKDRCLTYAVDGQIYLQADDPQPLAEGVLGFRTFCTELWFDNLQVFTLD